MSVIAKLRKFGKIYSEDKYEDNRFDAIYWGILERYRPEGYSVKVVDENFEKVVDEDFEDFEDDGRWSIYESKVYKVEENGEVAYFKLRQEEPATEIQEGMPCFWSFYEVVPKEVTVIKYEPK